MGWGNWVWVTDVCRDICKGAVIENCLNLNDNGLEAVKGCKCPTQDLLQGQLSQPNKPLPKPPNQGACFGMNLHSVPDLERALVSEGEENKALSSLAADRNVDPLSERTRRGRDFLLLKCLKACKKHSTVRSVMISRCTARVTAQVNKQMYTLHSPSPLTYKASVKSTPVTSKGKDCSTRAFTSGGGSGAVYGRPANFLQVTHLLNRALILCLARGTQYI